VNNQTYFRGLPTPANALLWIGIPHLNIDFTFPQVLAGIVITSFLLNSSLVFYRLQIKNTLSSVVFVFLILILLLVLWLQFNHGAWSLAIAIYILFSVVYSFIPKSKD